jgi:Short C-terminal domain
MRRPRVRGWLAVGVALWSLGCAAPRVTRLVYETGEAGKSETFVRLDQVAKGERFDHPAEIPPAHMRELLASVAVQRQTGLLSVIFADKPYRAFSDAELDLFSVQFSKALAEATPEEQAVFYINDPESNQRFRISSGAVYVQRGNLVVIIANYHYPVLWSDSNGMNATVSITSSRDNPLYTYSGGMYHLVVGKGQERLGGKEGWFSRWFGGAGRQNGVLLALNATPEAAPALEATAEAGQPESKTAQHPEPAAVTPSPSPAETAPMPGAAVPGPSQPQAPPVAVPPAPAAPFVVPGAPGTPGKVSPLEEKLRVLKKLRDDGLITDADYEAKKNELLKAY